MQWFKHDTTANQDSRLQNVLLDYGLEGYGLYWYCLELIAGKVSVDCITFELEHDARIIARNVGSTAQKVEEMMRYFVEIGLFENDSGRITCLKLAKRLDKSMTSNLKMRGMIENVRKHHDAVMTIADSVMQDKNRLDQIREDKEQDTAAEAPASSSELPNKCGIDFLTKSGVWLCPDDYFAECCKRYGERNVRKEFEIAAFWLLSNTAKRKTKQGMTKFLGSWLARKAKDDPTFKSPTEYKPVQAEKAQEVSAEKRAEWSQQLRKMRGANV